MPAAKTHILSIFLPNTLCFALHLFGSLHRASRDLNRGYLHGGVLADFVGQKPPNSRFPLLLLDCVVLVLQCLMLAVHSDREHVRGSLRKFTPLGGRDAGAAGGQGVVALGLGRLAVADDFAARAGAATNLNLPEQVAMLDQNAAERGEARRGERFIQEGDSVGLNENVSDAGTYNNLSNSAARNESPTPEANNGDGGEEADVDSLLHDVLISGLGMLGHYDIIYALRTASTDFESAAAHSLRILGYTTNLTAIAARRGSLPLEPPRPADL